MPHKGQPKEILKPFKKGFDARRNVSGRPATLEDILSEAVTPQDHVECFKKQVERGKKGDLRATEFIFGYAFGKPKQSTDITTNGKDMSPFAELMKQASRKDDD